MFKYLKGILTRKQMMAVFIIAIVGLGYSTIKEVFADVLYLANKKITGIEDDLSSESTEKIASVKAVADAIAAVEASDGNVLNAITLWDYPGFVADAVAGGGNYATGTDATPFLQQALNDAASGQLVIVPGGAIFKTPLDTIKGPKVINVLFLGNHYQNGNDLFIIMNPSGPYEQHIIRHWGYARDRINLPANSRTNYINGTGPDFASFTGTFVKIFNTSQVVVDMNFAEGFKVPVQIVVTGGGGNGAQENVIRGRKFTNNAYGISLVTTNGAGFLDKNKFFIDRISGGTAIQMDGYAGIFNGEIYNGTFTSNEFHCLIEQVIKAIDARGDIQEPLFNVVIEGGVDTGVFGDTAIYCRTDAPNYVRTPAFTGGGVFPTSWLASPNAYGRNGRIIKPIWNGGDRLGEEAIINTDGLILIKARKRLAIWIRNAAPSTVRFIRADEYEAEATTTDQNYTVADSVGVLYYNYASTGGTITFPTPNLSCDREVFIYNLSANAVNISNVTGATQIAAGARMNFWSNGNIWRPR